MDSEWVDPTAAIDAEEDLQRRKLAMAQALRSQPQRQFATGAQAASGNIADGFRSIIGGVRERRATDELRALAKKRETTSALSPGQRLEMELKRQQLAKAQADAARDAAPAGPLEIALLKRLGIEATPGMTRSQAFEAMKSGRDVAGLEDERKRWGDEMGIKRDELGLKRDEMGVRRKEAEKKGADELAKGVTDLRKEFQGLPETKRIREVSEAAKKIQAASNTGAGDMALLYGYMKILDPGSTVREGEFSTAGAAGGLPSQVQQYFNKLSGKGLLAPGDRDAIKAEAQRVYKANLDAFAPVAQRYQGLAQKSGYDPADVVLDVLGGAQAAQAQTAPAAGPPRRTVDGETRVWNGTTWVKE